MLLLEPYFDCKQPKQHGQRCKKSTSKYNSFGLPFILLSIACTISVTQFTLCKQFQQFMHFPNSSDPPVGHIGSAAENLKWTVREIPANGAFFLALMGLLSRMLDQGLSLQPTKD